MAFIDDFREIKNGTRTDCTQTDFLFNEILLRSGHAHDTATIQYQHIYDILNARDSVSDDINAADLKEDVSVVGGVTERICEIGLKAAFEDRYSRLPRNWKWLGDFAITGLPFNLFVSVKSYTAKERLIASGTGQLAAPIIGYGLFNDESEWSPSRVNQYKHKSFIAIYMPTDLYTTLSAKTGAGYPVTNITNMYGQPFLRDIASFSQDLIHIKDTSTLELHLERL